jgi:hypothetical protein
LPRIEETSCQLTKFGKSDVSGLPAHSHPRLVDLRYRWIPV